MYDRPAMVRASAPEMCGHASRGDSTRAGLRRVRAVCGRARLDAVLSAVVIVWILVFPTAMGARRVALIFGLLKICQSAYAQWDWASRS